eukprot:scaffold1351_cov176-Amphora_coffeaeformis.AAC.28
MVLCIVKAKTLASAQERDDDDEIRHPNRINGQLRRPRKDERLQYGNHGHLFKMMINFRKNLPTGTLI